MMDVMHDILASFGLAIIWLCLAIVAIKIVWNLGLPYAMIRDYKRTGISRGWSAFPLVEGIPLLIAALVAWLIGYDGSLAPSKLLIYGFSAVILSYVHLVVVAFVAGGWMWLRGTHPHKEQNGSN